VPQPSLACYGRAVRERFFLIRRRARGDHPDILIIEQGLRQNAWGFFRESREQPGREFSIRFGRFALF